MTKPITALWAATVRTVTAIRLRAAADDRGQSSSEYFVLGATILGILALIVAPRAQDIIGRIMDTFDAAVPG